MPTNWLQLLLGAGNVANNLGAFGPNQQQTNPSGGTNSNGLGNALSGLFGTNSAGGGGNGLSALLGAGLTGAGLAQNPEPGYMTEARQNIRNIESPQGYSNVFANTVGGLQNQFLPLLQQQADTGIKQINQQYENAFPGTVGMQGAQNAGLTQYLRDQLVPTQQAFLGSLGIQGIGQQQQAAYNVLDTSRPNPLGAGLTNLGSSLLNGQNSGLTSALNSVGNLFGLNGTQTGIGTGTNSGTGSLPSGYTYNSNTGTILDASGNPVDPNSIQNMNFLQNNPGAFSNPSGSVFNLSQGNALQGLGNELFNQPIQLGTPGANGTYSLLGSSGNAMGTYNPASGTISDLQGNVLAQNVDPATLGGGMNGGSSGLGALSTGASGQGGLFSNFFAPQAAGTTGLQGLFGGTGLLGAPGIGSAAGIFSGLGSGLGGFGIGNMIGPNLTGGGIGGEGGATLAGAGGGALAGFAMGGPIGAVIGGLTGAIGGFTSSQRATNEQKALTLKNDQQSQGTTTSAIGAFWTGALGSAGYQNLGGWNSLVQQTQGDVNGPSKQYSLDGVSVNADQPDNLAYIGSHLLLKQIQQQHPEITSLDQVQGFRQNYIDYIMQNTDIGGESGTSHPSDISQKGSLLTEAGL